LLVNESGTKEENNEMLGLECSSACSRRGHWLRQTEDEKQLKCGYREGCMDDWVTERLGKRRLCDTSGTIGRQRWATTKTTKYSTFYYWNREMQDCYHM